jgi:fumarate reductase subunit C
LPENNKESCFDFKFFKVRKTAAVIAILGILVFILTLFCMKQQNDYVLLMEEYYRQAGLLSY